MLQRISSGSQTRSYKRACARERELWLHTQTKDSDAAQDEPFEIRSLQRTRSMNFSLSRTRENEYCLAIMHYYMSEYFLLCILTSSIFHSLFILLMLIRDHITLGFVYAVEFCSFSFFRVKNSNYDARLEEFIYKFERI